MRKLFSLLLSLLLLFSLSACNAPEGESSSLPPTVYNGWYTEGAPSFTQAEVQSIVNGTFTTPKNVIVIIGDGMGPNDITLAEQYADGIADFGLVLNQIPHHGLATTHSADADITDSAASGAALSTGSAVW